MPTRSFAAWFGGLLGGRRSRVDRPPGVSRAVPFLIAIAGVGIVVLQARLPTAVLTIQTRLATSYSPQPLLPLGLAVATVGVLGIAMSVLRSRAALERLDYAMIVAGGSLTIAGGVAYAVASEWMLIEVGFLRRQGTILDGPEVRQLLRATDRSITAAAILLPAAVVLLRIGCRSIVRSKPGGTLADRSYFTRVAYGIAIAVIPVSLSISVAATVAADRFYAIGRRRFSNDDQLADMTLSSLTWLGLLLAFAGGMVIAAAVVHQRSSKAADRGDANAAAEA